MSDDRAISEPQYQPPEPMPRQAENRWGSPISEERKRELDDRLWRWAHETEHRYGFGPFASVRLTGADVFYLAARALSGSIELEGGGEPDYQRQLLDARSEVDGIEGIMDIDLSDLHLEGANLRGAYLEQAVLSWAHLDGANLRSAHLNGAWLHETHFEWAELFGAYLEGASLWKAHLEGADLRGAIFDDRTDLTDAILAKRGTVMDRLRGRNWSAALGGIRWGGLGIVELALVPWDPVQRLGDEYYELRDAHRKRRVENIRSENPMAEKKQQFISLIGPEPYRLMVRAYLQVAAQLRAQGMSEVADRFAYRARICERRVLFQRLSLPQYLFSVFLAVLAGYGYRAGRTVFWYLAVIFGFAFGYFQVTHGATLFGLREPARNPSLQWYEALVLSFTSFHGRGFFPQGLNLGGPITILAAAEAVVGLFIEISFIATFTQRFFAR